MKQRTITGLFIALFITPFVIFNEYVSFIYILLFLALGVYELLDVKKKANQEAIPYYVFAIAFIFGYLLIFDVPIFSSGIDYQYGMLTHNFKVNYIWIIAFLLSLFISSIFDKRLQITDSFYVFGSVFYLSVCLKSMLYIKSVDFLGDTNISIWLMLFVIVASFATDIFAYLGGMIVRKVIGENKMHKLSPRISPKKTIEGAIIGTLFGTFLGAILLAFVIKSYNFPISLLISFGLSIFSQIGDLTMSAIKRHFNIKDYSNILPGHGGLLDRIDSLLLVSLIFTIFMELI